MAAKKDSSLHKRHDAKSDRESRAAAEEALKPTTKLSVKPPAELSGHARASKIWKRIMSLYGETKGEIITAFDENLLVRYCLSLEEIGEIYGLRKVVLKLWDQHAKWLEKLKPKNENLKDYFKALEQVNALLQRFQGMDARLDNKRKMILAMEQSLYLTPRSRAGVVPEEKEGGKPKSDMDKALDE